MNVSQNLLQVPIILASQSPRRIMLLQNAGFQVEVIPSLADEIDPEYHEIAEVVELNARIKADEVLARLSKTGRAFENDTVLVAADTLVVLGTKVYGKPRDLEEAESFQLELGGVPHQVYSGVHLANLATGKSMTFHEVTEVTLRRRSVAEIHATFAIVNPMDKAAAYGYQDAKEIVEKMTGSDTNVIGLPMEKLCASLATLLDPVTTTHSVEGTS